MVVRRDYLLHGHFTRYNYTSLSPLLKRHGPVSDLIEGYFPDDFVDAIKLRPGTKTWSVEMEYGAHKITRAIKHLTVHRQGRVKIGWAARLKRALKDLYPLYLDWRGDVEGEPPAKCTNEVHKPWHDYRADVAFLPEDGHWRCVGCGWLYDANGNRVRERYYSGA